MRSAHYSHRCSLPLSHLNPCCRLSALFEERLNNVSKRKALAKYSEAERKQRAAAIVQNHGASSERVVSAPGPSLRLCCCVRDVESSVIRNCPGKTLLPAGSRLLCQLHRLPWSPSCELFVNWVENTQSARG